MQGVGIAAPAILSFLIIADTYPLKQQQFFMAILNGFMNAACAAAPVIGSYVTLYFHWHGNFTVLLLLGVLVFAISLLFLPSYQLPKQKETLSIKGYFPIFQSKPLVLLLSCIVLSFGPYWIFVGMSPLLYMKGLGVSLSHFGYYQGVLALAFALGSVLYGLVIHRFAQRKMLILSSYVTIASFVMTAMMTWQNSTNPLLITIAILLFVLGQIIPSAVLFPICLNFIPSAKARIGAVLQGGRLLLSSILLQLAGHLYVGSFQSTGFIISAIILGMIITLFMVINDQRIMSFTEVPKS